MTFNKKIVKIATDMISSLKESNFFEENLFVDESKLLQQLKERMQRKWQISGEMVLNENEFSEICLILMQESIQDTICGLVDKGAIQMSVGETGEIYYSANPDFELDKLFKNDEE